LAAEAVTAAVASAAALGADVIETATGQESEPANEAKTSSAEGGQEGEKKSGA
jgi:hypothetical protein